MPVLPRGRSQKVEDDEALSKADTIRYQAIANIFAFRQRLRPKFYYQGQAKPNLWP